MCTHKKPFPKADLPVTSDSHQTYFFHLKIPFTKFSVLSQEFAEITSFWTQKKVGLKAETCLKFGSISVNVKESDRQWC